MKNIKIGAEGQLEFEQGPREKLSRPKAKKTGNRPIGYLIMFALGVFCSSIIMFYFVSKSYENTIDLLLLSFDTAYLERDIRLLGLQDEELRCNLSMLSSAQASTVADADIKNTFIIGAPGLPSGTREYVSSVLTLYSEQSIQEFSRLCARNGQLY